MAEAKPEATQWQGGEVLYAGGTDFAKLGRSGGKMSAQEKLEDQQRQEKYPNLLEPTRLKALMDVKVAFVAAGPTAAHCIIGDVNGVCYTWGRNEKGQLGHGDQLQRNVPTIVTGLEGQNVVGAAGGKHHTALVTENGLSFCFGLNTQGQCGLGSINRGKAARPVDHLILAPQKALVDKIAAASCGADFTVWRTTDGKLFAAGHPIYGQLGDGSDHMYNAADSSIKIIHDPQPTPKPIVALSGRNVTAHACGASHTIAVTDDGCCWTWGNGNYGKLGHSVQQDEFLPRQVQFFSNRQAIPKDAIVSAGSTSTFATGQGGQVYGWGKLKVSGENATHPYPFYDLQGWHVRSMACGLATFAVSGEESAITWGHATNGELGYGPHGKKSSANPAKCDALEGMYTHQVACGVGFTLFLVRPDEERLKDMPVFEASTAAEAAEVMEDEPAAGKGGKGGAKGAAGAKRKAPAAAGKGKKAK